MSQKRIKIIISVSILCGLTVNSHVRAELTEDFEDLKEQPAKKSEIQHEGKTDGELSGTIDGKTKPSKLPQDSKSTQKNSKARAGKAGMVKFWSKSLSGFRDQGSLALEEDVVVTQDDIRIEADKATIFFEKTTNEVKEVHAVGSVRFQRFDPETGQPIRAEGKEAVFDNAKRMVTMKGEPVLHRGEDVVRGKVIYYNLTNGWVKADRVEGVVQPSVKKAGSK
jgi:lipopolysaccharide transport protein LptA